MAQRLSFVIAGKLSSILDLDDSSYQWLKYFLECKLLTLANCVVIFTIAAVLHQFLAALVFSLFFLLLRKFAGGYHARTPLQCSILSYLICFSSIYIAHVIPHVAHIIASVILWLISGIAVFIFAPVDHPDLQLSNWEKVRLKFHSRVVIICECGFALCAFFLPVQSYYVMLASISIFAGAVTMTGGQIYNKWEERRNEKAEHS